MDVRGMIRASAAVLALLVGCGSAAPALSPLETRIAFLREVHPSLERTLSAERLEERVRASMAAEPQHAFGDVRTLRQVLSEIGDAHLFTEIPAPSPTEATFVPFLLKEVDGAYLIDAAEEGLDVGATVLSVNGIAIADVVERLSLLANVDSARESVRRAEAERRFAELVRVELGPQESWDLRIRQEDGEEDSVVLPGVTLERLRALERTRRSSAYWGERAGTLPTLSTVENVTVLRLASFGTRDRANYLATVEALAPEIRAAERLAIDLRGNEGGDRSLGIAITRHLVGEPFAQWRRVKTRVREIGDAYEDFVSFPVGDSAALTGFPGAEVEDGWVVEGDPLAGTMTPVGDAYPGTITLFVDDATNSAAVEFAVGLLAHHPRVRVVGRETQGECGWHMGQLPVLFSDGAGPSMLVSLFEIDLVDYAGCASRRGIEPDTPVNYTQEDFDAGSDPYLRALLTN